MWRFLKRWPSPWLNFRLFPGPRFWTQAAASAAFVLRVEKKLHLRRSKETRFSRRSEATVVASQRSQFSVRTRSILRRNELCLKISCYLRTAWFHLTDLSRLTGGQIIRWPNPGLSSSDQIRPKADSVGSNGVGEGGPLYVRSVGRIVSGRIRIRWTQRNSVSEKLSFSVSYLCHLFWSKDFLSNNSLDHLGSWALNLDPVYSFL